MKFNKFPAVRVREGKTECKIGWNEIFDEIKLSINDIQQSRKTLVFECYHGCDLDEIYSVVQSNFPTASIIKSEDVFKDENEILNMTFPDVTDHRIFGKMTNLSLQDFFNQSRLEAIQDQIRSLEDELIIAIGIGASFLIEKPDLLVYADMARWEIQLRMRRNEVSNLGVTNPNDKFETQYKRAYFVDWRALDQHKISLMDQWDYVLDTNNPSEPKLADAKTVLTTLKSATKQPFSVVPFFDPGPWGGQWMRDKFDLDPEPDNFAWCFNCVPEENSLLLEFDNAKLEIPSINLVFYQPKELLGQDVYNRFGAEFPIRFDFLDTMDGGNLSLQVHPLTKYIQDQFGVAYTQDESYYMLDAGKDAKVYLGVKDGISPDEMIDDLTHAQEEGSIFDADKYASKWPAKKHDHFLIPAGTVHCSGEDCMVLEISATPYIFTFKLWDWGRLGMDGLPRPINIEHGKNVIQWDRTPNWTKENLINRFENMGSGDGWIEEKTGLHELEFIETRRHWFDTKIELNSGSTVNVMMLVEGEEATVESVNGSFDPFVVNYAEAFVIPAQVKEFTIKPSGPSEGKKIATVKAFVRSEAS